MFKLWRLNIMTSLLDGAIWLLGKLAGIKEHAPTFRPHVYRTQEEADVAMKEMQWR